MSDTATLCGVCGAVVAPGRTLCDRCIEAFDIVLSDIPSVLHEAEISIARQDVYSGTQPGGRSTSTPSPVNIAVSEAAGSLRSEVRRWASELSCPPVFDPLLWILSELRASLASSDMGPPAVFDIEREYRRVLRMVDTPPDLIRVGSCSSCGGQIRAFAGTDAAWCSRCRETYSVSSIREQRVAQAWNERGSLRAVVGALRASGEKISYNTAKGWARRGILKTPWVDPKTGKPAYTPAQVHAVATARRG